MLRVENLNTGYDKKQVLFDISFKITKGDIALFIGSNGSGKSTLLRSIYGLCRVWDGKVYFENELFILFLKAKLIYTGHDRPRHHSLLI